MNITCSVISDNVDNISWELNGRAVKHTGTAILTTNRVQREAHLYLVLTYYKKHAQLNDTGNYTCRAGRNSKIIDVRVTEGKNELNDNMNRSGKYVEIGHCLKQSRLHV